MLAEISNEEWIERLAFRDLEAHGFEYKPHSPPPTPAVASERLGRFFGALRGNRSR